MTVRIIEVIVSREGETTVQTKGYTGAECVQASHWLEQALGVSVRDNKTSEFFQTATAEQELHQQ